MSEVAAEARPTDPAKVKACLRDIERLYGELYGQALHGGNDGRMLAAAPIPGGDASVSIGPWSYGRNDGVWVAPNEATAILRAKEFDDDTTVNFHPLLTVEGWAAMWRDWFGHETALKATIGRASSYLRAHVHLMPDQTERDHGDLTEWPPDYEEMARELNGCRTHLESIVCDGWRHEHSRVTCMDCPDVPLIRKFTRLDRCECGPQPILHTDHAPCSCRPRLEGHEHERKDRCCLACRWARVHGRHDQGGKDAVWKCPQCNKRYDDDEHTRAKHQALTKLGTDRYVPFSDALEAIPRTANILRAWLARDEVRAKRDRPLGPLLVHWGDVREADRQATLRTAHRKRAS